MFSRRRFLQTSSLAAAAMTLHPLHTLLRFDEAFHLLRGGTGYFVGRGGTIGYLAGTGASVVIDAQFADSANTFAEGMRGRGTTRFDLLVNTHHHADHTGGNGVLAPLAERHVAQQNVPDLQRRAVAGRDDVPSPVVATETFEHVWSMDLGDEKLTLRHFGNAHTAGDTIVHIERANVVHMGDLVFNRMSPFVDAPGGASLEGWIDTLETAHAAFEQDTLFIYGHAGTNYPVTGDRGDLLVARDYLAAIVDVAREYVADGVPAEDVALPDTIPGFDTFTQRPQFVQTALRAAIRELSQSDQGVK
jgi:cyclase